MGGAAWWGLAKLFFGGLERDTLKPTVASQMQAELATQEINEMRTTARNLDVHFISPTPQLTCH